MTLYAGMVGKMLLMWLILYCEYFQAFAFILEKRIAEMRAVSMIPSKKK